MNHVLDELKKRSSRQRAGAVSPDPPARDPIREDPAASVLTGYCRYWIERLGALHEWPRDTAVAAVREAIRNAPVDYRPSVEDARLFVWAGGQEGSYREVVGWLKLRDRLTDGEGTLDPEVACHWLRQLGAPPTAPDPAWTERCRRIAAEAVQVGKGLSPATVAALEADPEAACGYLRCSGAKARWGEADARVTGREAPDPSPDRPPETDPPAAVAAPARPPAPPAFGSPGMDTVPVVGMAPGAGVGLALGGLVGGLFGGAVAGLKAAVSPAVTRAAPVGSGSTAGSPKGFRDPVAGVRDRVRAQHVRRAAAEAEDALTEFVRSARYLSQHPQLASFWREIDRRADACFAGDRAGALQEMAGQPLHPLRLLFKRLTRADPDVALHHGRAHTAFERLQSTWESCAATHRKLGTEWAPSAEQLRALRAACQQVPPAEDRPVLVEQAERWLRALTQTLQRAFQRADPRAAARPPAP